MNLIPKTYLYVPPFLTSADEKLIEKVATNFDGLYCEGSFGLFLTKRLKKQFFGGIELNVTDLLSYDEISENGATEISVSKELSYEELKTMPQDGWVLAGGAIKIMSLEYCMFGKKCKTCTRGNRFTLKDADGRSFRVRRYKLSSCRFEVYNCLPLNSDVSFKREIYDFTLLKDDEKAFFIRKLQTGFADKRKISATCGNFKKGVE